MSDVKFWKGLGDVYGQAVDQDGLPVAGVAVTLATRPEGWRQLALTAADGQFRLRKVPAGIQELIFRDPSRCLGSRVLVQVVDGWQSDLGAFPLEPVGQARVRIMDPQLPVSGAALELLGFDDEPAGTDGAGYAAFDCIPEGTYDLSLSALGRTMEFGAIALGSAGGDLPSLEVKFDLADNRFKVVNAERRLRAHRDALSVCDQDCLHPESQVFAQPPCAWPVYVDHASYDRLPLAASAYAAALSESRGLGRYGDSDWSFNSMRCPTRDLASLRCLPVESGCGFLSAGGPIRAVTPLASGACGGDCPPDGVGQWLWLPGEAVPDDAADLLAAHGVVSAPGPGEAIVFYSSTIVDGQLVPKHAHLEEGTLRVYFEGRLGAITPSGASPARHWSLAHLEFDPGTEVTRLETHLAWLLPG